VHIGLSAGVSDILYHPGLSPPAPLVSLPFPTDITEVTPLNFDDAVLALHLYRWKTETLLDDIFRDGPDSFRERVGLLDGSGAPRAGVDRAWCGVELDDFPVSQTAALPCGHRFSKRAWSAYLLASMTDPYKSQLTRCLATPSCNEIVRATFADSLLEPALMQRRREFSVRRFVQESRSITMCPGKDCSLAVATVRETEGRPIEDVTCSAGHEYCFVCARPPHAPVSCSDVVKWEKMLASDELLTNDWLRKNTKPCPKCAVAVERKTGCNKIICTRCETAMCWACGLEYYKAAGHAYPQEAWTCNRAPAAERASSGIEDGSITRFLHCMSRAKSSAESADFAKREIPSVADLSGSLVKLVSQHDIGINASDLDFFTRGLETVQKGREYLKRTYIRAFSLEKEVEVSLFADQQSVLEGSVERLQQYVESSAVSKLVADITEKLSKVPSEPLGAGRGASSGAADAEKRPIASVGRRLVDLRIEVVSLIRSIDAFTKSLTSMIRSNDALSGDGVITLPP
jgi:hypothetical protein